MRQLIAFHLTAWVLSVWLHERVAQDLRAKAKLVFKQNELLRYMVSCGYCLAPYMTVVVLSGVFFIPERFLSVALGFSVTVFWVPRLLHVFNNYFPVESRVVFEDVDDSDAVGFDDAVVYRSVDNPVDKVVDN